MALLVGRSRALLFVVVAQVLLLLGLDAPALVSARFGDIVSAARPAATPVAGAADSSVAAPSPTASATVEATENVASERGDGKDESKSTGGDEDDGVKLLQGTDSTFARVGLARILDFSVLPTGRRLQEPRKSAFSSKSDISTLSLQLPRLEAVAEEWWLVDFGRPMTEYEAPLFDSDGALQPNATGSCSNAFYPPTLDPTDVFSAQSYPTGSGEAGKQLFNAYARGAAYTSRVGQPRVRNDTLGFIGSIDKLLDCVDSAGNSVWEVMPPATTAPARQRRAEAEWVLEVNRVDDGKSGVLFQRRDAPGDGKSSEPDSDSSDDDDADVVEYRARMYITNVRPPGRDADIAGAGDPSASGSTLASRMEQRFGDLHRGVAPAAAPAAAAASDEGQGNLVNTRKYRSVATTVHLVVRVHSLSEVATVYEHMAGYSGASNSSVPTSTLVMVMLALVVVVLSYMA